MKQVKVIMVRVYITEASKLLSSIVNYLHNEAKVRGVSVFRAISGFGEHGEHGVSLMDLSLNLPLVVEFFDHPDKINPALEHLGRILRPEHIVSWEAQANENN